MNTTDAEMTSALPGEKLQADRMPGHWLLARLGKRVLRPGGLAMTKGLLADLEIGPEDHFVELAPGLGVTAQLVLARKPASYSGIERDQKAANWTQGRLPRSSRIAVRVGSAEDTGLEDASATMVLGEAMLSMNTIRQKQRIMEEAFRILRPAGRYAIHELSILPDNIPESLKSEIEAALSDAIHVGARPLTELEWRNCLEQAGFTVRKVAHAPMNLLGPARLVADEGLWRALRFVGNVLADAAARRRVLAMRRTFMKYRAHLGAIAIVASK